MYAIIRAGGKQHKVAPGDVIEIERVKEGSDSVEFTPLLIVDDSGTARSDKGDLSGARVVAKVVGESKGDKVEVNKFRNKTGYRRHRGHRQSYTTIQIGDITLSGGSKGSKGAPAASAGGSKGAPAASAGGSKGAPAASAGGSKGTKKKAPAAASTETQSPEEGSTDGA